MYNGYNTMISTTQLQRQVAQIEQLDANIASFGGFENWHAIEQMKLTRFQMVLQMKQAEADGEDPQQLFNEIGIITEEIEDAEQEAIAQRRAALALDENPMFPELAQAEMILRVHEAVTFSDWAEETFDLYPDDYSDWMEESQSLRHGG